MRWSIDVLDLIESRETDSALSGSVVDRYVILAQQGCPSANSQGRGCTGQCLSYLSLVSAFSIESGAEAGLKRRKRQTPRQVLLSGARATMAEPLLDAETPHALPMTSRMETFSDFMFSKRWWLYFPLARTPCRPRFPLYGVATSATADTYD